MMNRESHIADKIARELDIGIILSRFREYVRGAIKMAEQSEDVSSDLATFGRGGVLRNMKVASDLLDEALSHESIGDVKWLDDRYVRKIRKLIKQVEDECTRLSRNWGRNWTWEDRNDSVKEITGFLWKLFEF
jgi:hypothetical protein